MNRVAKVKARFLPKETKEKRAFEALVAVVDDGFAFHAVTAFLLDDSGAVGGLAFLDHRGAVTIAVAIPVIVAVAFAAGHASANWANLDADFFRQSRGSQRRNGRNYQSVFHANLLSW